MSPVPTIPRLSLAWLLAAQTLVIVPLSRYVPLWLLGLWLACTLWRVQIFRMRAAVPGKPLKALLVIATAGAVYLSFNTLLGLDAMAALLVATFILKLLEMHDARDARVLIFLGLFLVVVAYLFDAGLPWAAYSALPVSTLLAALIGLQQTRLISRPWATFRLAWVLMVQALPLMLLLFVFFPRLEPLWTLPLPSHKSITGLSDSMTPADVAELGRSTEVAFRADFDGAIPPKRELYWRALTLERFDGQRWSQSPLSTARPAPVWQKTGTPLSYRIILQPTGTPWLMALDVAETTTTGVRQLGDFRLQRRQPVNQTLLYSVQSWPQVRRDPQLDERSRLEDLTLPPKGNPQSRAWAEQLRQEHPQPDELVQSVLRQFSQQNFHYTLKPDALGADSVDDFLFRTRRGFCGHYAGAMTFVLRAAGVPARVVAGYQGGEINPAGNYLTVRQYQAHAWVEYWQQGMGWRSVDPTAAVSPQRIDQGPEQALAADEDFLADSPFSALRYQDQPWLNNLRLSWENLNYNWQRWVLGYQGEQQSDFFSRWFNGLQGWVLPVGGVLILLLLSALLLKPWRRLDDPQLRWFLRFEQLLKPYGLIRLAGEGGQAFAERCAQRLPRHAEAILRFSGVFNAQRYGGAAVDPRAQAGALNALRRSLKTTTTGR